nr:zinc finger, CCHC-type [Tanacetum cinerariifolium]
MHIMGKTVNELHAMLKLHEQTLPKSNAPALNAIRAGKVQKGNKHKKSHSQTAARGQNHGKGKISKLMLLSPRLPLHLKEKIPQKDSICHECGEIGHWKRNYPQYLAELMKKKINTASGAGGSGIFVIELNTILNRSWIYDTGCGTHICNTTQGLRASRKLKPGALNFGLEIVLNNCHYAPSITRGVISVSRLYEDGFVNRFVDNTIQMTTSSANNSIFRGFFEKQKLTGPNFIDWYRQLRIVLSIEDKLNYLEQPIPHASVVPAGQHVAPEILAAHNAWIKGSKEIIGLMLMTMEPDIQRNLETLHAHEMLRELKTLFSQQAEQELLQTTRDFHSCKQEEWQSVSSYVLKMKGYIDNLECLGHPVTLGLGVSLILISLRKEFDGFVQNYNMHSLGKTINELHAILKLHEQTLPKNNAPALHAIRADKVQKVNKDKKSQTQMAAKGQNHGKGKNKQAYAPKPKIPPPPKMEDPAKDSICHECEFLDHLKDHEIIAHHTPPYTPQHNGVSERRNKTLLDMVRSMMIQTTLPKSFWDYALETVARILNMVPTKKVENTRYENVTSRFQLNPGDLHWTTVKNILKYLRNTKDMFLVYGEPISMYCDNTGSIAIANESGITKGARHFRAIVHYLREVIEYGDIKLEKVHTDNNLADPLLNH